LKKTLLLIDGSSYLYRAFHALPDLRSAAGEPTGAIYGVLSMLRRLLADYKPEYAGCVFDAKGRTFRDDLYPEYKAHRPPMPDELGQQIAPLMEAIRALGLPILQIEGVEADDVIGTLARQAESAGICTVVSTGDKDLAQLVSAEVTLVNTMTNERLDPAGVEAKFGVPPSRIRDYLALVGDAVDNVPGVDKVGPKTAVKWLQQYGSLDGVVANAAQIKGVVGDNLRKSVDWLPKAKTLVTVKCDVALPLAPEDLAPQPRDEAKLAELFARFGFRSWLKDRPAERTASVPASFGVDFGYAPQARRREPDRRRNPLCDLSARSAGRNRQQSDGESTPQDQCPEEHRRARGRVPLGAHDLSDLWRRGFPRLRPALVGDRLPHGGRAFPAGPAAAD